MPLAAVMSEGASKRQESYARTWAMCINGMRRVRVWLVSLPRLWNHMVILQGWVAAHESVVPCKAGMWRVRVWCLARLGCGG